jgi:hypothetical protein
MLRSDALSLAVRPEGPATTFARQSIALCFTNGDHAGLALPAHLFHRVDIPLLDGKVARIIGAADAARCVGRNAVPLLTVLTPCADRAVPLLRCHNPLPPVQAFPVAVRALSYLHTDLKSRKLMGIYAANLSKRPCTNSLLESVKSEFKGKHSGFFSDSSSIRIYVF